MPRRGRAAGDLDAEGEAVAAAIEARLSTGHPLARDAWITGQEHALGCPLARRKPGPRAGRVVRMRERRGVEGYRVLGIPFPEFSESCLLALPTGSLEKKDEKTGSTAWEVVEPER
jgi:hypothetical protein